MPSALTKLVWLLTTATVIHGAAERGLSAEMPLGRSASVEESLSGSQPGSVWVVSTRHLGSCQCEEEFRRGVDIHQLHEEQGWRKATLSEFLASGESVVTTLVYVHGNRFDWNDAIRRGMCARESLAIGDRNGAPPVRYVIWSWPSDQIQGVLRDVRVKANRTRCEAYYLAGFLAEMDPEAPVSLIGFSYGARIITGALHLLGGGALCGLGLDEPPPRPPARVVLGAAAMHNHWLLPGHFHGFAFDQTDEMLVFHNSRDRVLKRYRLLDHKSRAKALGSTGLPACHGFDAISDRITQIDAGRYVGRSHAEMSYFCCPSLMKTARRFLLWERTD
ncbi:MAG: hypothetical protein ACC628_13955 [Pirellulaceae bacterium]